MQQERPGAPLPFEACENFRELGGYTGCGGRHVKYGAFYRSPALANIKTPADRARFEELGTQSGLRLCIWHHTLSEMASQPWLGRGFSYELDFINYSGEHITTTHSVYMGALLKGGIVGLLLLLAIIACGLWQAWRKRHTDSRYSLAILFYALVFMASQGMFIISNPRETWVLFWLPLGIALSKGLAEKR